MKSALKSVKKASKLASSVMVYHQAYLECSAQDNKWDLTPFCQKIMKNFSDDSSDSDEDYPPNLKVSKATYKWLREGMKPCSTNF